MPGRNSVGPLTLRYTCRFITFIPDFLKWILPSLTLDTPIVANRGLSKKSIRKWQTVYSLMRRLVTSLLILICTVWKKNLNWSVGMKSRILAQSAFYVNIYRAVIGPSATLTGRWRPDTDLRRMLAGSWVYNTVFKLKHRSLDTVLLFGWKQKRTYVVQLTSWANTSCKPH